MKRSAFLLFSLVLAFSAMLVSPQKVNAQLAACKYQVNPQPAIPEGTNTTLTFGLPLGLGEGSSICADNKANDPLGRCFQIRACRAGEAGGCNFNINYALGNQSIKENTIQATFQMPNSNLRFWLEQGDGPNNRTDSPGICSTTFEIPYQPSNIGKPFCAQDTYNILNKATRDKKFTYNDELMIAFRGQSTGNFHNGDYLLLLRKTDSGNQEVHRTYLRLLEGDGKLRISGTQELQKNIDVGKLPFGTYQVIVRDINNFGPYEYCKSELIKISDKPGDKPDTGDTYEFDLCRQAHPNDQPKCEACFKEDKIWTAVGCIPTQAEGIVSSLVRIGLGLSGGVVVLSVLAGAFMLATSSGDPKKVQEAQEMISAAVMGLLFVIFSVLILRFIVVNVLRIPGF